MDVTGLLTVDDRGAARLVRRIHRRVSDLGFDLPVRLWDGTELGPADADHRLVLHHPWSLRAMMVPGTDLATGEAYLHDAFDVEGSMVPALHTVGALQKQAVGLGDRLRLAADVFRLPKPPPLSQRRRARLRGDLHSPERDAQAIQYHYDTGNEFYELFLDANLTYSRGYFATADGGVDDPGEWAALEQTPADELPRPVTAPGKVPAPARTPLDRAQVRKLDQVCRKLALQPGERLLDIGCGWGSLLIHAAAHYDAKGVGVTLSEEQAAFGRERVARAGLADRVEIRLEDYRALRGPFDAVASIGMFEHVGADHHAEYFDKVRELSPPHGRFLNQHITTGARNTVRDMSDADGSFVAKYVFPDGALVPAWRAVRGLVEAGFEVLDVEQLRPHYARTLRHWVARLESNAEEARRRGGDVHYRIWRAYMSGSVVGFETDDLGVIQVLGACRDADLPAGRGWMTPVNP